MSGLEKFEIGKKYFIHEPRLKIEGLVTCLGISNIKGFHMFETELGEVFSMSLEFYNNTQAVSKEH